MKEIVIYVEFIDAKQLNATLSLIKNLNLNVKTVRLEQPKAHSSQGVGADLLVRVQKGNDINSFVEQINNIDNVNFAILTTC